MNSKVKEIIKQNTVNLVLYFGCNIDNSSFHAFLVITEQNIEKLQDPKDSLTIGDLAIVLYSNSGHDVPDYIIEAVTAGFKERFLKN